MIDGYLTLNILTHKNVAMKTVDPMTMTQNHPSIDMYSYKCAAGLKILHVEDRLMQKRLLSREETEPRTREELMEARG